MKNYVIALLILGILPSCGKRQKIVQDDSSRKSHLNSSPQVSVQDPSLISLNRQQEAKLIDVPLALTTQFIPGYGVSGDTISLGYTTDLTCQQIEQFYLQEMEKAGWQLYAHSGGYEQLLHFEKPHRICSISIRPHPSHPQKANMVIFVTPKLLHS